MQNRKSFLILGIALIGLLVLGAFLLKLGPFDTPNNEAVSQEQRTQRLADERNDQKKSAETAQPSKPSIQNESLANTGPGSTVVIFVVSSTAGIIFSYRRQLRAITN